MWYVVVVEAIPHPFSNITHSMLLHAEPLEICMNKTHKACTFPWFAVNRKYAKTSNGWLVVACAGIQIDSTLSKEHYVWRSCFIFRFPPICSRLSLGQREWNLLLPQPSEMRACKTSWYFRAAVELLDNLQITCQNWLKKLRTCDLITTTLWMTFSASSAAETRISKAVVYLCQLQPWKKYLLQEMSETWVVPCDATWLPTLKRSRFHWSCGFCTLCGGRKFWGRCLPSWQKERIWRWLCCWHATGHEGFPREITIQVVHIHTSWAEANWCCLVVVSDQLEPHGNWWPNLSTAHLYSPLGSWAGATSWLCMWQFQVW